MMSSLKKQNLLLVTFGVLTIIFGSLFAYEFIQVQQLKSSTITTSTTTITSTPSTTYTSTSNYTSTYVTTETRYTTSTITVTSSFMPDLGSIGFQGMGQRLYFQYKRVSLPVGTSVTFSNVTFYNVPPAPTSSSCVGYNIRVTFTDGDSEMLGIGQCPTSGPSIVFTEHSNPKAGIIFEYGFMGSFIRPGMYLLVTYTID
jgi:hypothetical protein